MATLSDPKPLRFARVEEGEQVPEWVKAAQDKVGTHVRPLELSQVPVDSIAAAPDAAKDKQRSAASRPRAGGRTPPHPDKRSLPPPGPKQVSPRAPEPRVDPALEAQLREATGHFAQAAKDLATARSEALSEVEGQLLDLVIRLSEVIIERELESDPALHRVLVRAALDCLGGEREVTLQVSEASHAVLQEVYGGCQFESQGIIVKIAKKPGLTGLGCIAETGHVRIDGRITQRLQAVRRAFEEERRRLQAGNEEVPS